VKGVGWGMGRGRRGGVRSRRANTGSTGHNVYPVYACYALGQGSRRGG
jgi:hypothetical protein